MTTTPAVPAPPATADATIVKDITWIKGHIIVSLLAIALIAGSIIGGIYLFENLIAKHDAANAAAQQKAEGIDTATQAALVSQLAQYRTQDAARDTAQAALIATLVSQMNQQHIQTAKQVATDNTMDATTAAARLVLQTKASQTDVTVTNNEVTMSLPLTRTVVTDLDTLTQATSDVTNLQGQLGAQQILTSDAKTELSTANQIILADKTELVATVKADDSACTVRVDAQAHKDLKRGFWAGLASFIGGVVLGNRI